MMHHQSATTPRDNGRTQMPRGTQQDHGWFKSFEEGLWLKPDATGAEEAVFISKALRVRRGQRVLDAPCGAGRVAVHLARCGAVVTGIDLQASFIKRARSRFREEGLIGTFRVMDLRGIDFEEEFHGIFNWSGSFGYFANGENRNVVRRYAKALRTGGRLLIDQPNREYLLRHFKPTMRRGSLRIQSRWDNTAERVISRWVVERGGRKQKSESSMRLYTPAQMQRLFEAVGLRVEAMYGGVDGERYRRSSGRLIMVGRK